jgi:hypothetical protein
MNDGSRRHRSQPRVITPGQKIHVSVLFKKKEYRKDFGKPIHSASPACFISFPRPWKHFTLWHDPGIYKYVDEHKPKQWERDIFDGAIAKVFMSQRRTSPHLDLIDWLALLASSGPSFPVLFQIRFTYLFDKESDILSACEGLAELVKDVVENTEADKCTRISATVTFLRLAPNLGEIDSVSLV